MSVATNLKPDGTPRQRNRIGTSCFLCRKRKVKCDREKPVCKNCMRLGFGEKCHYQEPEWTTVEELEKIRKENQDLRKELQFLQKQLISTTDYNKTGCLPSLSTNDAAILQQDQSEIHIEDILSPNGTFDMKSFFHAPVRQRSESNLNRFDFNRFNNIPLPSSTDICHAPSMELGMTGDSSSSSLAPTDNDQFDCTNESSENSADVDPLLHLTEKFHVLDISENQVHHFGVTSGLSTVTNDVGYSEIFSAIRKAVREIGEANHGLKPSKPTPYRSYIKKLMRVTQSYRDDMSRSEDAVSNAYYDVSNKTTEKEEDPSEVFLQHLTKKLPSRSVCLKLVEFYRKLPNYFHINLKLQSLERDLIAILPESPSDEARFVPTKQTDYTIIGLFLLIIRVSYVSLPWREIHFGLQGPIKPEHQEWKLLGYEIGLALRQENKVINCTVLDDMKVAISMIDPIFIGSVYQIQLMSMIKTLALIGLQQKPDFEYVDVPTVSGLAVHSSLAFGLHRDPDVFVGFNDPDISFLWRVTWQQVMLADTMESLFLGKYNLLDDEYYDTKLPEVRPGKENDREEVEEVAYYRLMDQLETYIRRVVKWCNRVDKRPRRSDIEKTAREIDDFLNSKIEPFAFLLTPPVDFLATVRANRHLCIRATGSLLLCIVLRLLSLTCGRSPQEKALCRKYIKDCATKSTGMVSALATWMERFEDNFPYEIKFVTCPFILHLVLQHLHLALSLLTRFVTPNLSDTVNLVFIDSRGVSQTLSTCFNPELRDEFVSKIDINGFLNAIDSFFRVVPDENDFIYKFWLQVNSVYLMLNLLRVLLSKASFFNGVEISLPPEHIYSSLNQLTCVQRVQPETAHIALFTWQFWQELQAEAHMIRSELKDIRDWFTDMEIDTVPRTYKQDDIRFFLATMYFDDMNIFGIADGVLLGSS